MTLSRTNIVLAGLTLIVALLALNSSVDYSRPNIEILPDMKYTPAYGAYDANPNFPNGRTLQPPVSGTIARGQTPIHYGATPEDAVRAGVELENPTLGLDEAAKQASAQRGSETYRILCASCHGAAGKGDGLVPKYGFPPPPSLRTGKSVQMKDGQLFHILTYGQGSMPNFAAQLSHKRRWEMINFIRTLHDPVPTNLQVSPQESPSQNPSIPPNDDGAGQGTNPEQNTQETTPPEPPSLESPASSTNP